MTIKWNYNNAMKYEAGMQCLSHNVLLTLLSCSVMRQVV